MHIIIICATGAACVPKLPERVCEIRLYLLRRIRRPETGPEGVYGMYVCIEIAIAFTQPSFLRGQCLPTSTSFELNFKLKLFVTQLLFAQREFFI